MLTGAKAKPTRMGGNSFSAQQTLFIAGGTAILLLALTGQNGCLFPGADALGYISTHPPHVWFAVSEKVYNESLHACNLWQGNLTGRACYQDTDCIGGSVCMSRYRLREDSSISLCCCRFQQQGRCCDPEAVCPGCKRSMCPDGFDPCDYEICYRHPNATCMKDDICRECRARFFYNGTEVTNICHVLIFPSRETPTASGYMPTEPDPEGNGDEEPPSSIQPSSMVEEEVAPTLTSQATTPPIPTPSP